MRVSTLKTPNAIKTHFHYNVLALNFARQFYSEITLCFLLSKTFCIGYNLPIFKAFTSVFMFRLLFVLLSVVYSLSAQAAAVDNPKLAKLLAEHWQNANQEQLFFRKDPDAFRMNGKLPDISEQGQLRRQQFNQSMLDKLAKIDLKKLSAQDQVTYRLFRYERQAEADSYQQLDHFYPLNYYSNWFSYFAGAPANMSFLTEQDYQNYLVSLADFPRYNQEFLNNLELAIKAGHTHYCDSLKGYRKRIIKHIVDEVTDSVFYAPLKNIPAQFDSSLKTSLQERTKQLIQQVVIPEYQKIDQFYVVNYLPACRKTVSISQLEGGKEYYDYLIKYYTTTDYTADQIHQLGLDEVKRIRSEMLTLIKSTGFKGSFDEFVEFLRTDPQFYTDTELDLLEKVSYMTRKISAQLPKWFGTLPRNTFDVKPSPNGGAYYVPADGSGTTSGTYFIDTRDLKSQPLYNLEALTLHEAEPGHHFQTAIAHELEVPEFRKTLYHSAYGEGWGLYSESLGKEMGFYQDPYSDFGRLTYEMWRACRLVVDTGMHSLGWTRQQAIDYLAENTALSMADVEQQIDRYITWPAQALSYKIGELKIRELRQRAEQKLGKNFKIRDFHDQILKNGSLPLDILEELFDLWLVDQVAKNSK